MKGAGLTRIQGDSSWFFVPFLEFVLFRFSFFCFDFWGALQLTLPMHNWLRVFMILFG